MNSSLTGVYSHMVPKMGIDRTNVLQHCTVLICSLSGLFSILIEYEQFYWKGFQTKYLIKTI